MEEAKLYTFGAGDENAYCDFEFFSKKALENQYEQFKSFVYSQESESLADLAIEDVELLKELCMKYIFYKINTDSSIKHGDVYWVPAWGCAGWYSIREEGFHHVVDTKDG